MLLSRMAELEMTPKCPRLFFNSFFITPKFKMSNGKIGIVRSNTSVVDFVKKTYTTEYFWMDQKKKTKNKQKCKIVKK